MGQGNEARIVFCKVNLCTFFCSRYLAHMPSQILVSIRYSSCRPENRLKKVKDYVQVHIMD